MKPISFLPSWGAGARFTACARRCPSAFNPFRSAGEAVADEYCKRLGLDASLQSLQSLQSLPDEPRFVFNATNHATGVSFRFSKPCATPIDRSTRLTTEGTGCPQKTKADILSNVRLTH